MESNETRLILASGSPRRRELLSMFGRPFEVVPARGEEAERRGESPAEYVMALAAAKAAEVAESLGDPKAVYIAADTVVELEDEILGKPGTPELAREMLSSLSGREHRVWSGLCLRQGERQRVEYECTRVFFRPITPEEIEIYIASGEPLDKAGAYGIQGRAALFAERLEGDYFNVMGLPLCRLGKMLADFGAALL